MIADPVLNLMSRPYRGLSVQEVSFELTEPALLGWITGRNVYRRTEFILVRNAGAGALIALGARESTELFGPVTEARVLALSAEMVMVDSPATDVGNASAMAEVAGRHRRPGVTAYVVTGRYRHVNFGTGLPPRARRLTKCCLLERGIETRGGVAMSERAVRLLEPHLGRPGAYAAVRQAATATQAGRFAHLGGALAGARAPAGLDLEQLRDPRTAVASAEALVRAWSQARNLRDI